MTTPNGAVLRPLARKVLARRMETGTPGSTEALAAAVRSAYDDLARVSVPLIGQVGIEALAGRALHLAQREYPWLVSQRETDEQRDPVSHVVFCLQRHDPAVGAEAAGAVFAVLAGLLHTFIGEPLTTRLLRKAWPDAFNPASTEESQG